MRKVISGLFISLDGVVEAPDQWQFDVFDADMGAAMTAFLASVDTILLGRKTYQEWEGYWPTSDDLEYGAHINYTPKFVVSTTLNDVSWGKFEKPTLIKTNIPQEIARLKQQSGKSISTAGSPTLVRNLLAMDLLDELTLMIHPVVVGKGKKLFPDGLDLKRLKLMDSKITGSGVAFLTYVPA